MIHCIVKPLRCLHTNTHPHTFQCNKHNFKWPKQLWMTVKSKWCFSGTQKWHLILCFLLSVSLWRLRGWWAGKGEMRGGIVWFEGVAAVNECDCSESDVLSRGVETLVFSEWRESPWQQLKAWGSPRWVSVHREMKVCLCMHVCVCQRMCELPKSRYSAGEREMN